jgi:hypothetical protein
MEILRQEIMGQLDFFTASCRRVDRVWIGVQDGMQNRNAGQTDSVSEIDTVGRRKKASAGGNFCRIVL